MAYFIIAKISLQTQKSHKDYLRSGYMFRLLISHLQANNEIKPKHRRDVKDIK
jgi:hypothetical protein